MNRTKAFTLIELLVVIAIIGILAAITFPVFARMKDQAYKSSDLSNLNSIRTALQLYRADQGAYPPALLGYATGYSNIIPTSADIIPANQVIGAMFPKRIDSLETLRPAYERGTAGTIYASFTTAYWPNKLAAPGGADPLAYQRFGPGEGPNSGLVSRCVSPAISTTPFPNYYYRISGYDVASVIASGAKRLETHYTLFWTGYTVPSTCSPSDVTGGAADNPRQLGYSEPPETTVITWDSYFRDYDNGNPTKSKKDIVLFLGGGAKPFSSLDVYNNSWQVQP